MEEKSLVDELEEMDAFAVYRLPKSRFVDALTDYLTRRPHSGRPPASLLSWLGQITAPRTKRKLQRSYLLAEYLQDIYQSAETNYRNYLRERFAAIGYLSGCFSVIGSARILNGALDAADITGEAREVMVGEFVAKLPGVYTAMHETGRGRVYLELMPETGKCPRLTMDALRNSKDLETLKADFTGAESVFELYCKHLIYAWSLRSAAHTDAQAVLDGMKKYAFYAPVLKAKAKDLIETLKTSKQVYVRPETLRKMFEIKTRNGRIDLTSQRVKETVFPEPQDVKINRERYRLLMQNISEIATGDAE
jgi:hypothetical protein